MATTGKCAVYAVEASQKCSKCQSTFYCGRAHQVEHWPTRKAPCKLLAAKTAPSSGKGSEKLDPCAPSFTFGGKPLHEPTIVEPDQVDDFFSPFPAGLKKEQVYERIVDIFRLWVEDQYSFNGETYGLYNDEDPIHEFRRFVKKAVPHLPSWWTPGNTKELLKMCKTHETSNIEYAVEKSDIREMYGNPMQPMVFRAFAEKVIGEGLGAFGGGMEGMFGEGGMFG